MYDRFMLQEYYNGPHYPDKNSKGYTQSPDQYDIIPMVWFYHLFQFLNIIILIACMGNGKCSQHN